MIDRFQYRSLSFKAGEPVEFDVESDEKGARFANNVSRPNGEDFAGIEKISGKVKYFDTTKGKGFGFIIANDGSGEFYVPMNAIKKSGFKSLKGN